MRQRTAWEGRLAGTTAFVAVFPASGGLVRLVCIDCGSTITLRRLIFRGQWRYTACPSCEGFEHYMRGV